MTETLLELQDVECRYDREVVVSEFSLQVEKGSLVCLLGPSGCGKTTALRAIAGFQPVRKGFIRLRNQVVSQPGFTLTPEKRKLGVVFQDYALFPHLTLEQNIAFGIKHLSARAQQNKIREMLALVGLEGKGTRYPQDLSGGQQQRVALARSLAPEPDLLLMDEPFSNLDVELRERLSLEVHEILKQQGTTGILVTHDQHEAFAMGEKIAVMNHGRILQWDTPYNIYHQPKDRFVADFIGQGTFLRGTVLSHDQLETEAGIIKGKLAEHCSKGAQIDVLIRPDDVLPAEEDSSLCGEVIHKAFKGAEIMYTLRLATGGTLMTLFPSHHNHEIGERVPIKLDTEHLVTFPVETQSA